MPAANLLSKLAKGPYRLFGRTRPSASSQDVISLRRINTSLPAPQDPLHKDDKPASKRVLSYILCYILHAFLVALHLVLLVISSSNHMERRIVLPHDSEVITTGLSGGLQAFYTLYTALLIFVTQNLVLSATFSGTKKLTQIHDVCTAWGGFGASLSTLWSQTKVASSALSVSIVMAHFVCVSVLHVASSTIIQLQPFNDTMTRVIPVVATWPGPSVDLNSLDWMAVTTLVPFMQSFYGNITNGLSNSTLYDIPMQGFVNASVNATTLNAHCGLLTNLSIVAMDDNTWNITSLSTDVGPLSIWVSYLPMLNEIWFSPSITCFQDVCTNMILYLVSAAMEVDDSVTGINHVYLNGTYFPPGGTPQNFTTPTYLVGCSLDRTTHEITLDPFGNQLGLTEQPNDVAWSNFLLGDDVELTSGISFAMSSANSLPPSPYCQPIMEYPELWAGMTAFNVYMESTLGMGLSPCNGSSDPRLLAQYTTPGLLSRGQFESAVSQIATEFIWLAGELGSVGGGFDRQTEESKITGYVLQWRLNINVFSVIAALCASVVLCTLVVCMVRPRDNNTRQSAMVSAAGVLEIMWLGSHSQMLRDRLKSMRNPSVDSLRASSLVFETVVGTHSTRVQEKRESGRNYCAIIPLYDTEHASSSGSESPVPLKSASESIPSSDLYKAKPLPSHTPDTFWSRRWCYVLHTVLVALHIILLVLLIRHPEHSVVIPFESNAMTTGLSALLQAIYTLYSALLVVITQRLALFRITGEQRKLTTIHDVSGAWTGIGAAIYILWQQHKILSSFWEVTRVTIYLTSMLVLHIGSSSVMQWKTFNSTAVAGVLPMDLPMPGSAVNISTLKWPEIFPIARSISQDTDVATYGLSNSTLHDVPRVATTLSEASVNATTLEVRCGLVPNLILSYQGPEGYQIGFSLNGSDGGNFLEPPIWKDVVYSITPKTPCAVCPQTLFYMVTTAIDTDESVHDTVAVNLNWTYTPPDGVPQNSMTVTHIVACSVSARTFPATLNLQEEALTSSTGQVGSSSRRTWSVWSPSDATDLSAGMATALTHDITGAFGMFQQSSSPAQFTDMDSYMMYLLGLDLASANATSVFQSSANPSVMLTPSELENAIAQTAAKFLWLAGQLGETGGGFQRDTGESQAMRNTLQWQLNINAIPVFFVSIASFTALILLPFVIGKGRSKEHGQLVSGTSVLESLWLEAQSEVLHSHLKVIEEPRLDRLRAAGMFDISLGDIGRPSLGSE